VQRVSQQPQAPAHFGHRQPVVEQRLGLSTHGRGKLGARPARGRHKKGAHPPESIELNAALDGDERHAEGPSDLGLGGVAIEDQLAAEHPKGGQVIGVMQEDR
jgi:hypothetical protein